MLDLVSHLCYNSYVSAAKEDTMKKIETERFIKLWNIKGFRDVGLMCEVFDLTRKQVLRRVRNLRYRKKCLKLVENRTQV